MQIVISKIKKQLMVVSGVLLLAMPYSGVSAGKFCGDGKRETGIDFGCTGTGNAIVDMVKGITKFLAGGVGIVVVLMIIIAGIQYMSSSGNPQAIQAAKGRLGNAIIALLLFIFAYAIIQYLIPSDF